MELTNKELLSKESLKYRIEMREAMIVEHIKGKDWHQEKINNLKKEIETLKLGLREGSH